MEQILSKGGFLSWIEKQSHKHTYTYDFSIKDFDDFKNLLSVPREVVSDNRIMLSEDGHTLMFSNDEAKKNEIYYKWRLEKISDSFKFASRYSMPFDIVYLLSVKYRSSSMYCFNNGKKWNIKTHYPYTSEYDDRSISTDIELNEGGFRLTKTWSDGYYDNKEIFNSPISIKTIFNKYLL